MIELRLIDLGKNKGSGNIYSYRVRNRAHLMNIIIPFFEKHSLKTRKK